MTPTTDDAPGSTNEARVGRDSEQTSIIARLAIRTRRAVRAATTRHYERCEDRRPRELAVAQQRVKNRSLSDKKRKEAQQKVRRLERLTSGGPNERRQAERRELVKQIVMIAVAIPIMILIMIGIATNQSNSTNGSGSSSTNSRYVRICEEDHKVECSTSDQESAEYDKLATPQQEREAAKELSESKKELEQGKQETEEREATAEGH